MEFAGRRISSQHRQLDDFHAMICHALDGGAVHSAHEAFQRFQDAAEAHLSLEEELYFPALRTLQPDLGAELDALVSEHAGLRQRMKQIEALLAGNERELSSERLAALAAALADHEHREEELAERIAPATGKPA